MKVAAPGGDKNGRVWHATEQINSAPGSPPAAPRRFYRRSEEWCAARRFVGGFCGGAVRRGRRGVGPQVVSTVARPQVRTERGAAARSPTEQLDVTGGRTAPPVAFFKSSYFRMAMSDGS